MLNRLLIFFVALLPLFNLTSCGDDDDYNTDMALWGIWAITEGDYFISYTFNEDGTGVRTDKVENRNCEATFDWTSDEDYIYMTNARPVYGFDPADLNEDGTVKISDGGRMRFRRIDDVLWLGVDDDMIPFDLITAF